jgi:hypothetical protein
MNKNLIPKNSIIKNVIKTNDGMVVQQGDKIHTLNYTACEIYELCNGRNTIEDIYNELKSRYPEEDFNGLVENLFIKLQESGLIEISDIPDKDK